jgi:hypothetical protein
MAGNAELDALGKVHQLALRGLIGLLKLPGRAVWRTAEGVLLWLGEEFRRWATMTVAGLMIFLFGKAVLNYAPPPVKKQLVMITLVLVAIWSLVAFRAAWFTLHNNLRWVRQRQWFREMKGEVKGLRGSVGEWLAEATQGTPMEGAFRSNRQRRDEEAADARAAAQQAEADRQATIEHEQRLDELAALEPNPHA